MTIAVLGGASKTGSLFVTKALKCGYDLRVLTKHPDFFTFKDDHLEIVGTTSNSEADIAKVIDGSHAVVEFSGKICTEALDTVIPSMDSFGLRRLIYFTTHLAHECCLAKLKDSVLDWTLVQSFGTSDMRHAKFNIPQSEYAEFILEQITNANHIHDAVALSR